MNTPPRHPIVKQSAAPERSTEQPPSYLYPLQKQAYIIPSENTKRIPYTKENGRDHTLPKEEEIKPKLVRPRNLEAHFKEILNDKQFVPSDEIEDEDQDFNDDEQRFRNESVKYVADRSIEKNKVVEPVKHVQRTKSAPTKQQVDNDYRYHHRNLDVADHPTNGKESKYRKDDVDEAENTRYRENLTDKQKYEKQRNMYRERQLVDGFRVKEPNVSSQSHHESKGPYKNKPKYDNGNDFDAEETTDDHKVYRHKSKVPRNYDDMNFERNPYKEPASLPYHESIERMIKSPAMRYKSFEDSGYREGDYEDERMSDEKDRFGGYPLTEKYHDMRISQYPNESADYLKSSSSANGMYPLDERHSSRQRYKEMKQRSQSRSPDTVMRVPPKERFQNAKEKFKAIERDRPFIVEKISDRPYVIEKIGDRPYIMEKMKGGK